MSSTLLHTLADPEPMVSALTDVAETSLYAYVDLVDGADFAAAAAAATPWLEARLRFSGPATGTFTMRMPAGLATMLAGAFAGAPLLHGAAGEPMVTDFAGEVANMICGAWLTRACRHVAFDLTAPQVETTAVPRASDDGGVRVLAALCDTPVCLHVRLDEPGAPDGPAHGAGAEP